MKQYNEKTFDINKKISIECWTENTSYGFRHLAQLRIDWRNCGQAKVCYYNRTWESFEYESVLKKLITNSPILTDKERKASLKWIEKYQEPNPYKTIVNIAKLGSIFTDTKKGANDWKVRILKAGLENKGLIIPEDWNDLTEEEKEKRLNGAIEALS